MIIDWLAVIASRLRDATARRPDLDTSALLAALDADYPSDATVDALARRGDDGAPPDRVTALAGLLALADDELVVLLAAVAPDLDANLGLGLAQLAGASSLDWTTVQAALELAGVGTTSARVEDILGAGASLLRHGLIEVIGDGPRLHRRLRPSRRLVAHVAGSDEPDPDVLAALVDVVPVDDDVVEDVVRVLDAGAPLVWLRGPATSARAEVAAAAYAQCGVAALAVDLTRGLDAIELARAAVREGVLTGRALVVAGLDDLARVPAGEDRRAARAQTRTIADLLTDVVVPVLAVGETPWQPEWSARRPLTVEVGRTEPAEVRRVWAGELADLDEPDLESLLAVRLAPRDIVDAVDYARLLAVSRGHELGAADVRESARLVAAAGGGVGRVATSNQDRVDFDDLVLGETALADLRRIVGWVRVRHDVVAAGPVHGKAGKGTGIAALFTGGPGTGKTLAAHVIADELGLDLFQVDLTSVVDKYIGETERNLERLFTEAESRDVVLFFDEADALFGRRSDVKDSRDRYANQEVSYLLQRLEHFDGLTILATNLRGNLDQAFIRRIQFMVHFADPDEATRLRLWSRHLGNAGRVDPDDPPDPGFLAGALEMSGGDIRNVVLGATYDAAAVGDALGARHLVVATRRELAKLGRQIPPSLTR